MPKVSILIPVYNVEPYIEKCIRSVQNQTFTDFECIIVNDCTPDRSIELVQSIIESDNRFRIVHHETNKGLGEARNTGLKYAMGEYVTFIDSDDYVEPEYLKQLYEVITLNNCEIVEGKYVEHRYSNKSECSADTYKSKAFYDTISKFLLEKIHPSIVNKLYKKYLFDKCTFPTGSYEDACVNVLLVARNKVVEIPIVQQATYHYERRAGSITTSCTKKLINDYVENILIAPIQEFSKANYDQIILHESLCFFEFIKIVYILQIIFLYSKTRHKHFCFLRSKIQTELPSIVQKYLTVQWFFTSVSKAFCLILIFFPAVRLYLQASIFWYCIHWWTYISHRIIFRFSQFLVLLVTRIRGKKNV